MPHLVIQYTANIEATANMDALCQAMARTIIGIKDEDGKQVYPTGGTRVLAYPAAHHAVADAKQDYAFVYLNFRVAKGRSAATLKHSGEVLLKVAQDHFADLFVARPIGITLQIDEGLEVFDAKHSSLHPLFKK
jgi:5-carboxymethyl-2-hydroxymuconate isomerase